MVDGGGVVPEEKDEGERVRMGAGGGICIPRFGIGARVQQDTLPQERKGER